MEECDEVTVSAWVYFGKPSTTCQRGEIVDSTDLNETQCCYNVETPILGSLNVDNPNITIDPVAIFNSDRDRFDEWVGLTMTLSNVRNQPFNVILDFTQGLSECCDYDIFLDDMRVDCFAVDTRNTVTFKKCPGFELRRLPDNKKSWVYNPGLDGMGVSDFDNSI